MKLSGLVLAVFALVAVFDVSSSAATTKHTPKPTPKATPKPTPRATPRATPKPTPKATPTPVVIPTSKPVAITQPNVVPQPQTNVSNNSSNQPTWASDGETCEFFEKPIFLDFANYFRMQNNQKALKVASQKDCVPLCPSCNGLWETDSDILCAQLKNTNTFMPFLSKCLMDNYICKTGDYYSITDEYSRCNMAVETVLLPDTQ